MSDSASTFDINQVIDTAKQVITKPVDFYRNMPTSGGFADPIIFAIVMSVVAAVLAILLSVVGIAKFSPIGVGAVSIMLLIWIPIGVAIGVFVMGAVLFVIWRLMGSDKDYETALRCAAYSTAILPVVSVLSVIPYVAGIIQKAWGCYLMFVASLEIHKLKEETSKIDFWRDRVSFSCYWNSS